MLVLCQGSSNGFVHRVFEAGADDILVLPQPGQTVSFTIQKALARRGGARARGVRPGSADRRARPEGRHRQDAHLDQPRRRAGRTPASASRSSTSTSSSATSRSCMGLPPGNDDLRPRARRRHARRENARRLPDDARRPACGRCSRRPGPTRRAPSRSRSVREVYALAARALRRRDRRHAARVHAGGDRVDRRCRPTSCMVGMLDSLSLKNTKLGLETLELMGYDPEHDHGSCSTGPTAGRHLDRRRRDRPRPRRPTCSSRATGRSRAASTKGCRSSPPSRSPTRPRAFRQLAGVLHGRGNRGAGRSGGSRTRAPTLFGRKKLMELHERLTTTRPVAPGQPRTVRRAEEPHPHAR